MDIPLTFALSHSKLVSSLYRAQVLCFYTFSVNGKHPRDDESWRRSTWNGSPPATRVCNLNSFWGLLTCFRFYPWKSRKDGQEEEIKKREKSTGEMKIGEERRGDKMMLRETVQVYQRIEILNMSSCLWGAESEEEESGERREFFSGLFSLFPIFVVVIGH